MERLVSVKAEFKDAARLAAWMGRMDSILDSREIWTRPIRTVGIYMMDAFDTEGSSLTGRQWQGLSQMTRDVRMERGYSPDHPILHQSGTLRGISAGTLAAWGHGSKGYIKKGTGVSLSSSLSPRRFSATISGPKVANNYGTQVSAEQSFFEGFGGDRVRRAGYLPARPFFYIDRRANMSLANQMAEAIMSQWQSHGATRTHGRMSVLPMGGSRRQAITTSW